MESFLNKESDDVMVYIQHRLSFIYWIDVPFSSAWKLKNDWDWHILKLTRHVYLCEKNSRSSCYVTLLLETISVIVGVGLCLKQWFPIWRSWLPICHFLGFARASDENIHNYFHISYFVCRTTCCRSQNNRITWQIWQPTFSFKIVLKVIMTITVLLCLAMHELLCDVGICCVCKLDMLTRELF